jgi:hypothetical protein
MSGINRARITDVKSASPQRPRAVLRDEFGLSRREAKALLMADSALRDAGLIDDDDLRDAGSDGGSIDTEFLASVKAFARSITRSTAARKVQTMADITLAEAKKRARGSQDGVPRVQEGQRRPARGAVEGQLDGRVRREAVEDRPKDMDAKEKLQSDYLKALEAKVNRLATSAGARPAARRRRGEGDAGVRRLPPQAATRS